jgi:hypothetical protein
VPVLETRRIVLASIVLAVAVAALLRAPDAGAQRKRSGVRIECSSLKDRYAYCRTHAIGDVRLERQLSKTRCREYETWGSDGDGSGIWVKDGCRGIFTVGRGGRPTEGRVKSITCTSKSYDYAHCDVSTWGRRVWVQRQISDTRCVQGDNWGVDWRGIWVDRGCNAVFAVR